jgi:hypothetical protein
MTSRARVIWRGVRLGRASETNPVTVDERAKKPASMTPGGSPTSRLITALAACMGMG